MNYRSLSVPVNAKLITTDNILEIKDYLESKRMYIELLEDNSEWFVEFPNGEIHVIEDRYFQQRFALAIKFTKSELSYAARLAMESDCV